MNLRADEKAFLKAWIGEDARGLHFDGPAKRLAETQGASYPTLTGLIAIGLSLDEQGEALMRGPITGVTWPWTPAAFAARREEAAQVLKQQHPERPSGR